MTEIAAGSPLAIALYLYPATESGPVTAGQYSISVPLDEKRGVSLELGYVLVDSGEVELPPWSGRTVRVRYAFDLYPGDAWRRLRVRIEDGYGRVFEELDMADLAERRNSERRGVFAVELPQSEPLHILLLRREGEAWAPCRRVWDLATEEDEESGPTVLMFDDCVPR